MINDGVIQSHLGCVTHSMYFYGMSWRWFESVFGLHIDLRWPADEQDSALYLHQFTDRGGMEGLAGLGGKSKAITRVGCVRQPALSPTALHALHIVRSVRSDLISRYSVTGLR